MRSDAIKYIGRFIPYDSRIMSVCNDLQAVIVLNWNYIFSDMFFLLIEFKN